VVARNYGDGLGPYGLPAEKRVAVASNPRPLGRHSGYECGGLLAIDVTLAMC